MAVVIFVLGAIVGMAVLVFGIQNQEPVTLRYLYRWETQPIPLFVVIMAAAGSGFVIASLSFSMLPLTWSTGRSIGPAKRVGLSARRHPSWPARDKVWPRRAHRPPPRWHAPMWPFNAAAIVLESTLKPLGLQSPLHRRRLDFFRKSFVFSTVKAQSVLGFAPSRQFAGGASETAAWYRERGYLS